MTEDLTVTLERGAARALPADRDGPARHPATAPRPRARDRQSRGPDPLSRTPAALPAVPTLPAPAGGTPAAGTADAPEEARA